MYLKPRNKTSFIDAFERDRNCENCNHCDAKGTPDRQKVACYTKLFKEEELDFHCMKVNDIKRKLTKPSKGEMKTLEVIDKPKMDEMDKPKMNESKIDEMDKSLKNEPGPKKEPITKQQNEPNKPQKEPSKPQKDKITELQNKPSRLQKELITELQNEPGQKDMPKDRSHLSSKRKKIELKIKPEIAAADEPKLM
eukprot:15365846-Ditylum_brightwellii.AAC.2